MAEGFTAYSGMNCSVQLKDRQPSFMWSCCGEARCFKNFLDLEDCIIDSDPEQLFCYVNKNADDIVVTSTPHNLKLTEFMKDVWDFKTHKDFANGFITDVNSGGFRGCPWHASLPMAQNFLNFMQFFAKFGKIICWHPPWRFGAPSYRESWICPWWMSTCTGATKFMLAGAFWIITGVVTSTITYPETW